MPTERNVTSIMHFLLGDATHGHTWPGVTGRDGQEEDENKWAGVAERGNKEVSK